MEAAAGIAARHKAIKGFLDERQRRLHAAVEARALGYGGVKRVSDATGVARGSILAGIKELDEPESVVPVGPGRVRRPGAGRRLRLVVEPSIAPWLGSAASASPDTRPLAEKLAGAAEVPCHRASTVSTRPLGA